ncbi:energy-coupling factor ABC transporter ATP-binding protein [Robinsoniella sp. KNHs210]|uniref:energy-coupling factor ABC transporter ATP-binding protein n=1 Tax=Robinsoniella sp. KNHs210 TaxID=1469950 RepID=UPI000481C402|nr:ATP-binding cassette domain-containing protein [Robinsoniella sp. KNHs210]
MSEIILNKVNYTYPNGSLAADDISLHIKSGENAAVIGKNGAGKTTLAKMLNGLLKPQQGDVFIGNRNTKDYTTAQISKLAGYVFQNPDEQIFHATVEKEVAFAPKRMKLKKEDIIRRTQEALKRTKLEEYREENPYNLPLSLRKFVTIAAVLAMEPDIYILDEPTAGQDMEGNRKLTEILRYLHSKGKTVITITHDMEFVAENCKKIIVMANNKIIRTGSPEEIFRDMEVMKEANLKPPSVTRICTQLGFPGPIHTRDAAELILKHWQNLQQDPNFTIST